MSILAFNRRPCRCSPSRVPRLQYRGEGGSAFYQQMLSQVNAIPGVERVGISSYLPLERNRSWDSPRIKGKEYAPGELPGAFVYVITPGYLQAMGMRLHGRDFTWSDDAKTEQVIILNKTVTQYLFPGEDAVGRMVFMNGLDRRVIGVFDDVHEANVEGKPGWQAYFLVMQEKPVGAELVVRTKLPPEELAKQRNEQAPRTKSQVSPPRSSAEIQTIVDHAVSAPRRFFVMLVVSFAVFGSGACGAGHLRCLISYSVTHRTQEIGIRMALGATVRGVQFGVIGKTIRLAFIGIVAGTVAAISRGCQRNRRVALRHGSDRPRNLRRHDRLAGSLVALVAGYLPARRASRIDPMVVLRNN